MAVSKAISLVFRLRTDERTAPNTEAYTTEAAMLPLWSMHRWISLPRRGARRP
jgi:hypothetical protein